jgi:hypothetical protein
MTAIGVPPDHVTVSKKNVTLSKKNVIVSEKKRFLLHLLYLTMYELELSDMVRSQRSYCNIYSNLAQIIQKSDGAYQVHSFDEILVPVHSQDEILVLTFLHATSSIRPTSLRKKKQLMG